VGELGDRFLNLIPNIISSATCRRDHANSETKKKMIIKTKAKNKTNKNCI